MCEYSLTIRQRSQNTQSCFFDLVLVLLFLGRLFLFGGVLFCFEKGL